MLEYRLSQSISLSISSLFHVRKSDTKTKMNLERETMNIVDIDIMVFLFSNQPIIGVT